MLRCKMRFSVFIFFLATSTFGIATNSFTNKKINRKVDISTHLVKITSTITAKSDSDDDTYVVLIDSGFEDHLAFIGAVSKVGEDEKEFVVEESKESKADARKFNVKLPKSKAGTQVSFILTTVFGHKLVPYPAEITQSEKQLVKFVGNTYFYSPYPTDVEETQVVLSSGSVISYSQKLQPNNKQDSIITYGPYKSVAPLSKEELSVHYENNSPFLTVTSMTRLIEVSHWGNIAVEETLDVYHSGALLKGSFSRYDYQRHQEASSSVNAFKTVLPAASKDVYYRDEIGNISTSHMREMVDSVELELRPRFPLFGGWKTHYTIGYNVPSYEYLFHKGDQFALRMRFMDHVLDDQLVDHLTLRVILPEGVSDVKLVAPYPIQEGPREIMKTYLDSSGRTVIVAHKANLVEHHIREFKLYYRFKTFTLIREPLMVITAFYLLFGVFIIYVRLDFSITKDEVSESKMRVAGIVEEVQTTQDRRSALYQAYEDATNKFKASKDQTRFGGDKKKIDSDHRLLTQQIAALQVKLRVDSLEASDKVNEIQALDAKYREQVTAGIGLTEKLVSGKINKQQYLDMDAKVASKKAEFAAKIDSILSTL